MSEFKTGYRVKLESGYTYWTMSVPNPDEDVVYLQKFAAKPIKSLQPGEHFFWAPLSTTKYEFLGREDEIYEFDYTYSVIQSYNKVLVSARVLNTGRAGDTIDVLTPDVHVFVPLSV